MEHNQAENVVSNQKHIFPFVFYGRKRCKCKADSCVGHLYPWINQSPLFNQVTRDFKLLAKSIDFQVNYFLVLLPSDY